MKSMRCVVPLCALLVGCGAAAGGGGGGDAGTGGDPYPGTADGGKNANSPLAPNIWLTNAALGLGDVRVCFHPNDALALPSDNTIPATNYPGLGLGHAVRLTASLQGQSVTPVLFDAHKVAVLESGGAFSCAKLAQILSPRTLPIVSIGGGPTLLAITGCPANTPNGAARCGKGYTDGAGNLGMIAVAVATNYDARFEMGVQVLNLAPSVASVESVRWGFGPLSDQCGGTLVSEGTAPVGTIQPSTPVPMASPTEFDALGVSLCDTGMGRKSPIVGVSYAAQQGATNPASVPAEHFAAKGNFVFASMGEVGGAGASALRVLAIPFGLTN